MRSLHKTQISKPKQTMRKRTLKRLNCAPAVSKSKRVADTSCYTADILLQIRDEYNKTAGPNQQIKETNPIVVWQKLAEVFPDCEQEDCWLNTIQDKTLRAKIHKYIFAPNKPSEWKKDPNTWLSNFDILNVLEQYETTPDYKHFEFIGPTPIDFDSPDSADSSKCVYTDLCKFSIAEQIKQGKTKIGVIFNLDKHTGPGSHWVSLFIDLKNNFIFYFDSAGNPTPKEITAFVKRIRYELQQMGRKIKYYTNGEHAHQKTNTECGMYSLHFIITMLTEEMDGKPISVGKRIRLFQRGAISDTYVEKYRNIYFNG